MDLTGRCVPSVKKNNGVKGRDSMRCPQLCFSRKIPRHRLGIFGEVHASYKHKIGQMAKIRLVGCRVYQIHKTHDVLPQGSKSDASCIFLGE